MQNYQQDWMFTQQDVLPVLESATLGRQWHLQMNDALAAQGQHFGFGGTMCSNYLQSTEMPVVTNGRTTDDYHAGLYPNDGRDLNWRTGLASVFQFALGVVPAKDGFWSTAVQPGHPYKDNRTEPFANLQAAVAVLTRGPVSPSDKIGLINRTLVMRTCTEDGTLLQPDVPARALDAQVARLAFGAARHGPDGEVWATFTDVAGAGRFFHVLAADLKAPYALGADDLANLPHGAPGFGGPACLCTSYRNGASPRAARLCRGPEEPNATFPCYPANPPSNPDRCDADWAPCAVRRMVAYENSHAPASASGGVTVVPFLPGARLALAACGKRDFALWHTAPVLPNGWAFLGETGKFVPVAANRLLALAHTTAGGGTGSSVAATVAGVPGETVRLAFYRAPTAAEGGDGAVVTVACTFGQSGRMTAEVPAGTCA